MLRSAAVVIAVLTGYYWITGAPYGPDEEWRVFAGWCLITWAIFNIPAFIRGSKGWAKLFLAFVILTIGLAFSGGKLGF